jgi:hypothetical protein
MYKATEEGAIFRGSIANGLRIGALCASMTSVFDWTKENLYYFLGPHMLLRLSSTAVAVTCGALASMPFDMIRVRM